MVVDEFDRGSIEMLALNSKFFQLNYINNYETDCLKNKIRGKSY